MPSYFISRQVMHAEQAQKISGYERESPSCKSERDCAMGKIN